MLLLQNELLLNIPFKQEKYEQQIFNCIFYFFIKLLYLFYNNINNRVMSNERKGKQIMALKREKTN